jgi:hypothetical protein
MADQTASLFGLTVQTADWMPQDTLLIFGSCWCRHSIGDHLAQGQQRGCAYLNCDCDTPLDELVRLIKLTPEESR